MTGMQYSCDVNLEFERNRSALSQRSASNLRILIMTTTTPNRTVNGRNAQRVDDRAQLFECTEKSLRNK